jgi:hypothetical protein
MNLDSLLQEEAAPTGRASDNTSLAVDTGAPEGTISKPSSSDISIKNEVNNGESNLDISAPSIQSEQSNGDALPSQPELASGSAPSGFIYQKVHF